MRLTATKDGVTRVLSNMAHVNAYVNAGYDVSISGKKLYANGKALYSTQELNAFINGGYTIAVEGGTPIPTPTYTVSFSAGANGSLTGTALFTVDEGTLFSTINVPTPVPDANYKFSSWSPALPAGTTEITSNMSFTAQFTEEEPIEGRQAISGNSMSLDELKEEADKLGISYHANIGYDKLLARINEMKGL